MLKYVIAGALTLAAAGAHAATVTPADPQGWAPANVRTDAMVGITGTYKPAGEQGSLEFTTNTVTSGQDKADYTHALNGTLGSLLGSDGELSFDYFVDSASTSPQHLAPALRLAFLTDTDQFGYLVWENVYNGGSTSTSVTEDAWVSNNILGGNFWMRTFAPGGHTVEQFGVTLADWAGGTNFADSYTLNASTRIVSIEIGVGSGWGGSFKGAVDHVNVGFSDRAGLSANFEPNSVVPEPASWALMIGGFGAAGVMIRRRRALTAA